jgi:hypothetical protein
MSGEQNGSDGALEGAKSHLEGTAEGLTEGTAGLFRKSETGLFPLPDVRLKGSLKQKVDEGLAQLQLSLRDVKADVYSVGKSVRFHEVPSRIGLFAVLQIGGKFLRATDKEPAFESVSAVGLLGSALNGKVSGVFVFTDAEKVDRTFTRVLWSSWQNAFFKTVRHYDKEDIELFQAKDPRDRADDLRLQLDLEEAPPAAVELTPAELDDVVAILAARAAKSGEPSVYFGNLVAQIHLPTKDQTELAHHWHKEVNAAARSLVEWTLDKQYPAGRGKSDYSILGSLLEALTQQSGVEEGKLLLAIIRRYGLIRNREALDMLTADFG